MYGVRVAWGGGGMSLIISGLVGAIVGGALSSGGITYKRWQFWVVIIVVGISRTLL